ncbi:MAG: hypothetical protein JRG71_08050 [Deltaproteobacteria bacterium]|nr:hypothetical protein [Deltaproteobacteria bacterium]
MVFMQKIIVLTCLAALLGVGLAIPAVSLAEDYSFNLEKFEKKSFEWGGYTELKWDHHWINTAGSLARLEFYDNPRTDLDRLTATLQLEGNYHKGIVDFNGRLQASSRRDQVASEDHLDIFSAYASIKPSPKRSNGVQAMHGIRLALSIVRKISIIRKTPLKAILALEST